MHSRLSYQWKEPRAAKEYRSGVSLHGHTNRSREGLTFISEYVSRRPLLRFALATQERKAQAESSITIDFAKAYWTPPLSPLAAFQLERDQIERGLGIAAMVSLTDHDNIEAPMSLRIIKETADIPISLEWSVPYQNTTLHLGLHNLPADRSENVMAQLAAYTANPAEECLFDLLAALDKNPDVLIVLNHPMWDLAGIGRQHHIRTLTDFVVAAADEAACRTIEQTEIFRLSVEDQRQIAEAILNPPEPVPALRKAFRRYRDLFGAE